MAPSSGSVGSKVTLALTSSTFPLGGDYLIQWSSTSSFEGSDTVVLKRGTASKDAYAVSDSFIVPETERGRYYVQFVRLGRDDPVTFQFNLMPSMKLSPTTAKPGNKVTISCKGFPANAMGSIILDGENINVPVTTNSVGSFTREITVPNVCAGGRIFEADVSKLYPEKVTAVLQIAPVISIEPKVPSVKDQVTITGHGFADNSAVSIQYGNIEITNSPKTDDSGNFTYKFNLPEGSRDADSLTATDTDNNKAVLTISVEKQTTPQQQPEPPPETPTEPEQPNIKPLWKPHAISPNGGIFGVVGGTKVNFYWQQVTNAEDVTYTLQIADNIDFIQLKPGMQQTGLKQNVCTLNIEPGKYYWRVKAIDGSGNESQWSYAPSSFQVGIVSKDNLLMGIFVLLALIIVFMILTMIIRAISRHAREYYN